MTPSGQAIVQAIEQDTRSGAAQLAGHALAALCRWLASTPVTAAELDATLSALTQARPSMVALTNAVQRCRQQLHLPAAGAEVSGPALPVIRTVHRQLSQALERVALNAAELVPEGATVLTHSHSSQVLALFRLLAQRRQPYTVIATQSGPGNEGFELARALDALGVPVTVITDAQIGVFVARSDLVLSGCDTWLADGYFINKSGTYLMALAARDQGRPLWVLADSFKDSPATHTSVPLEEMPADELGAPSGPNLRPRNVYFETVPVRLITGRVSERGVFSCPAGAAR